MDTLESDLCQVGYSCKGAKIQRARKEDLEFLRSIFTFAPLRENQQGALKAVSPHGVPC